jgi:hypothetical protein
MHLLMVHIPVEVGLEPLEAEVGLEPQATQALAVVVDWGIKTTTQ